MVLKSFSRSALCSHIYFNLAKSDFTSISFREPGAEENKAGIA